MEFFRKEKQNPPSSSREKLRRITRAFIPPKVSIQESSFTGASVLGATTFAAGVANLVFGHPSGGILALGGAAALLETFHAAGISPKDFFAHIDVDDIDKNQKLKRQRRRNS